MRGGGDGAIDDDDDDVRRPGKDNYISELPNNFAVRRPVSHQSKPKASCVASDTAK